jgi:hypothetical protein
MKKFTFGWVQYTLHSEHAVFIHEIFRQIPANYTKLV